MTEHQQQHQQEVEEEGTVRAQSAPAAVATPVRAGGLLRRLSVCAGTPRASSSTAAAEDDFKRLVGLGTPAAAALTPLPGERARKRPRCSVGTPVAAVAATADAALGATDWRLLDSVGVAVAGADPTSALAWLDGDADEAAARAAVDSNNNNGDDNDEDKEGAAALLRRVRCYSADCAAGEGAAARALAAQLRLGVAPCAWLVADAFVVLLRAHSVHAAPAAAARRFLRTIMPEASAASAATAPADSARTADERLAAATGLRAATIEAMRSLQSDARGVVSVAFPRAPRPRTSTSTSASTTTSEEGGGTGGAQCTTLRGAAWAPRVLEAAAGGAAGRATLLAPVPFVHGTLRLPRLRVGTTLRLGGSSSSSSAAETVATATLSHGVLPAPLVRDRVLPFLRARIARAAPACTVTVHVRPSTLTAGLGDVRDDGDGNT